MTPAKPWLMLSPRLAHDLSPIALQLMSAFRESRVYTWRPFTWRGLEFKNRLGLAGGVDKDGERIEDWWCFGPGFIEVGTVTPRPQIANPGKIIDREASSLALWNKMGFPNRGADYVRANLHDLPDTRLTPVFVNIGKNRDTPNSEAARDYRSCIETLADCADAFVINISSPNTTGLRDLFSPETLRQFLREIIEAKNRTGRPSLPLLLKLSPDLELESLDFVVKTAADLGIDGFIATNTTLAREGALPFPAEGGVSGRPLANRSEVVLQRVITTLDSARSGKLIVSVGGVMTPEDVMRRLDLGADLVQVYTALIYDGPKFFEHVARTANAQKELMFR